MSKSRWRYLAGAFAVIALTGWILSCSGSGGSSARAACERICACSQVGSSGSSCAEVCSFYSSSEPPASSSSGSDDSACYHCIATSSCSELQSSGACSAECGSTGFPVP